MRDTETTTCPVGVNCYTCRATTGLRVVTAGSGSDEVCWTACEDCARTRRTLRLEPRAALWMLHEHRRHRGLPVTVEPEPPAPRPLRVPAVLDEPHRAVDMIRTYFDGHASGSLRFTGAWFDSFAGGGDRQDVASRFTAEDIVAVSMLSVNVPARAAIRILGYDADRLTSMLEEIPTDLDLMDAEDRDIGAESCASLLWKELRGLPGIGPVITSKLLARKRPRLIPIRDKVVLAELGHPGVGYWRDLRAALRENDGDLAARLANIRDNAELAHEISVIRTFDILTWMSGIGRASEATVESLID